VLEPWSKVQDLAGRGEVAMWHLKGAGLFVSAPRLLSFEYVMPFFLPSTFPWRYLEKCQSYCILHSCI
jgi:hypothetical protein